MSADVPGLLRDFVKSWPAPSVGHPRAQNLLFYEDLDIAA